MTPTKKMHYAMAVSLGVLLACALTGSTLGERLGGDADIIYESLNAGGCGFATNAADTIKLGGSLGQGGMILICTNANLDQVENGFWKAEDACTLYPADLADVQMGTNEMGVTFYVINSNRYEVRYVTEEEGGLVLGQHAFTNVAVAAFEGQGLAGAETTVWFNVSSATNIARYYLIHCE
ncbi:MAG: hypothetical protein EOM20_02070 [Spartobacteria bacterium]|nr:hypothetical protein [Spartobacteria bacterium]